MNKLHLSEETILSKIEALVRENEQLKHELDSVRRTLDKVADLVSTEPTPEEPKERWTEIDLNKKDIITPDEVTEKEEQ